MHERVPAIRQSGFKIFRDLFRRRPRSASGGGESNACHKFVYTREQAEGFGRAAGWKPNFIGDWSHPRDQMIVEYVAA